MEHLLETVFTSILTGGAAAVLALLLLFIAYLIYDKYQFMKEYNALRESHDKTIMEIIDKYHAGQLSLVDTLNELKVILTVLKERD